MPSTKRPGVLKIDRVAGMLIRSTYRIERIMGKGSFGTVHLAANAHGRMRRLEVPWPTIGLDQAFRVVSDAQSILSVESATPMSSTAGTLHAPKTICVN